MKNRSVTFVLGLIVFIAAIVLALSTGGSLPTFIHIPSFLFVAGVAGGLGIATYKGGGLLGYIAACRKHFIPAGVLGTVIGVILTLRNLESPSQIGTGIAVALFTIFYSLMFYCVADALVARAKADEGNF
jgi:flagellar motor component MotA